MHDNVLDKYGLSTYCGLLPLPQGHSREQHRHCPLSLLPVPRAVPELALPLAHGPSQPSPERPCYELTMK